MTLVYNLEGQEGCKCAANILYRFNRSTSGEKTCQSVSQNVVDPALALQLANAGVDEGITRHSVFEGDHLRVVARRIPRNVDANLVVFHFGKVVVVDRHGVEKLPPKQLHDDDLRRWVALARVLKAATSLFSKST